MKSKKRGIVGTVLLCVVVILGAYLYAHIDKNNYLYDRNVDTGTYYGTGILVGNDQVSQSFVVDEDSIDGINIKISLTGNVEDVILQYTLVDDITGMRYDEKVKARELDNNKFNLLTFNGISETRGKSYTLILSSENSDEQNGVSFFAAQGVKENQRLVIKGNESEGTLVTRIVSHRFDVETFVVFTGIVIFIIVFIKVLYKSFK